MTEIVDGFAQPDVVGADPKTGKEIYVFVEEGMELLDHEEAIIKSIRELMRTKFASLNEIRIVVV